MPFGSLKLHADLLRGIKELGFVKPTPIQADAIPPAMEGRDVLAAAATGSGKTAAFLLPILHRLIGTKRGTTRALIITPTRELAAQVVQELNELAVHTPITAAAVFGGVGMQPQEHAFRSGVDVIVATPGRLLDHLKYPYAKLNHIEYLVLDEADRMLDMGFLPDIHRVLQYIPRKRQTLFFSATLPPPIVALTREMLHNPATLNVGRTSTPAVGITQAVYPVPQDLKTSLLAHLLESNVMKEALVFTRTKHRANRLWEFLEKRQIAVGRIHGNRSQAQRTDALEGFKSGRFRVLVATDIAARGIDVEALGHVVNFDVPSSPEDYVHRVGRTARAELTGEAFTFASPDESEELRAIERAVGKPLLRVTVPDFDYTARRAAQLEIPLKERIAKIRADRAEARARTKAKEERRAAAQAGRPVAGEPARAPTTGQRPRGERPAAKRDETPYRDGGAPARSDERRPAGSRSRGTHRGPDRPGSQDRSSEARRPEGRGPDGRRAETRGPDTRGPEARRPEGRGAEARGPTGRGASARRGGRRGSDRPR